MIARPGPHCCSKTGAILVPQRAVQQGPKGPVVYVVGDGDQVEIRGIQASSWQANQWLTEEGLHAGEQVVGDGFQRIMRGSPSNRFISISHA